MKRKAGIKVCHVQELLLFTLHPQAGSLSFLSWGFGSTSFAFPGRAVTQWLTEQGCTGEPHGVVLTENKTAWCQSQPWVVRHPCSITKQLLPWFRVSEDCRILEGWICLTRSSSVGMKLKPMWCIGGTFIPQRFECTHLLPRGISHTPPNVASTVSEKAGPSRQPTSETAFILSKIWNSIPHLNGRRNCREIKCNVSSWNLIVIKISNSFSKECLI